MSTLTSTAHCQAPPHLAIDRPPPPLDTARIWSVWRYEESPTGRPQKVPYHPGTGRRAKWNDPGTHCAFEEAQRAHEEGGWDGVGFFVQDDTNAVDLDACRDPVTGDLATWAQDLVTRFDTYAEVSPSGTGVHLLVRGRLPAGYGHKVKPAVAPMPWCEGKTPAIEVYDGERFWTWTGQHLPDTPNTIEACATFLTWYTETFRRTPERRGAARESQADGRRASADKAGATAALDTETLLEKARRHPATGGKFRRLFDDGDATGWPSPSEADYELCTLLAFWTNGDADLMEDLYRQSALYQERRDKWDRPDGPYGTYGNRTIEKALQNTSKRYTQAGVSGTGRRTSHHYEWQSKEERPVDRQRQLRRVAESIKEEVAAHVAARDGSVLAVLAPPGIGKTHTVAELGVKHDLAWVAQRHDMAESVAGFTVFSHIQPCGPENCDHHQQHALLAQRGYNTWPAHESHPEKCAYLRQFDGNGSALFQLGHVPTRYVTDGKEAIVIDEVNLPDWLEEKVFTASQMAVSITAQPTGSTADRFLRAVHQTLLDVAQESGAVEGDQQGWILFAALDKRCEGHLVEWLEELESDPGNLDLHPMPAAGDTRLYPVVAPHLVSALAEELPKYKAGGRWNGRVRMRLQAGEGPVIGVTRVRAFTTPKGGTLPPVVVLDATGDVNLLALLMGRTVWPISYEMTPPPHLRHIAVRTGKHFGKTSLCHGGVQSPDRTTTIAQARYLLQEVDPDGSLQAAGKVGLITFKDFEALLGDALGVPAHRRKHFWGLRGSNDLEDCDILLVVGTPRLPPDQIHYLTRVLHADDPTPIVEGTIKDQDGWGFRDPRCQRVSDALTQNELTQAAHRIRPLRYDGRTVLTLCDGTIQSLPVTETITSFPHLTAEGVPKAVQAQTERHHKLTQANDTLTAQGRAITADALAREAGVRKDYACRWLRQAPPCGHPLVPKSP